MKNRFTLFLLLMIPILSFSQQSLQHSWRYYRPGNTGIQGDNASALWVDANGHPYIAASTGNWGEGGFAVYNHDDNTWANFSNVDYPVLGSFDNADVQIMDIVEDFDHNLWMGNFTGAVKYNPETGISEAVAYNAGNSELNGFTYDIDVAPDSTVWFISDALVRYDPKTDEWTSWLSSNIRLTIQPKPDGSYLVWSADTYYGQVFTYNSATGQITDYLPSAIGDIAGLPGKDCVDDAGNMWALRMTDNGNWETLEYQKPDGTWVYPTPPYENVSYYIDAFKAYGDGKALLVTANGEVWQFDGSAWNNLGTWRPYEVTSSIDIDQQGNVWVCGVEGAARHDAGTGEWQRYRITNTSQIDYFIEDLSIDADGNVWMTGNAGSGVGGFQKFDGSRWTGFNPYTYGLGYPFPFQADNTQAIYWRPSNGEVVFNPTFNGIHSWDGNNFSSLEDYLTTSKGFTEDSQGRLWSLGEYYNIRYYNGTINDWTTLPITGWGARILPDPANDGNIWATTDYEILRTDGINTLSKLTTDFPGSSEWFTGFAADQDGIVWVGTWLQFTSTGSTLIRYNTNTDEYQIWSHDEGWPFPGEHVRPLTITPDGKLWMQYDSEYPSTESGLLWYDGTNIGTFPSSPGGVPAWGVLPNSTIKDLEVKLIPGGYELWMSCLGRGIAVLSIITNPVGGDEKAEVNNTLSMTVSPNPAAEKTAMEFNIEQSGPVQLSIYDMQGKIINTLIDSKQMQGKIRYDWNLQSASGSRVAPGIYFARLSTITGIKSMKVVVK
ncbi:MAG: T9SS type A sorting domain-containing protein [Bacteroidales bacterium]|nr:T9SS type A sorting domain-containing protein [Bacteroidales bacterium]